MYGNLMNGGLVAEFRHNEIVSDFGKYWYMNADDENVYYSDGTDGHYLFRMSAEDPEGSMILKKPCANVILNGDWLYYINELDRKVYRCLCNGRSESMILNEEVTIFIPYSRSSILYVTASGDLKSQGSILAQGIYPTRLYISGGMLYYADRSNHGFLTCIDLAPDNAFREQCLGEIVPISINGNAQYIFFTDALQGASIYRMGALERKPLKICDEKAGFLHVIDERIFFWNGKTWKTIPISGGNAKEVR